jgi:rhodanese-related sulfurtransferase
VSRVGGMQGIPTVTVDQVPPELPEGVTVLDVREPVEWHHGHVAGSVHVPLREIPQRLGELPSGGQLLVVCKIGGRSAQAVQYLNGHGFEAVNLAGGLIEWHAAGRPLVSEAGEPMVV